MLTHHRPMYCVHVGSHDPSSAVLSTIQSPMHPTPLSLLCSPCLAILTCVLACTSATMERKHQARLWGQASLHLLSVCLF